MSTNERWPELNSLAAVPPSFTGTASVAVNDLRWGVLPGSRTAAKQKCVFVLTPDTAVHLLTTRRGKVVEIVGPPQVMARMTKLAKEEFFSDKEAGS